LISVAHPDERPRPPAAAGRSRPEGRHARGEDDGVEMAAARDLDDDEGVPGVDETPGQRTPERTEPAEEPAEREEVEGDEHGLDPLGAPDPQPRQPGEEELSAGWVDRVPLGMVEPREDVSVAQPVQLGRGGRVRVRADPRRGDPAVPDVPVNVGRERGLGRKEEEPVGDGGPHQGGQPGGAIGRMPEHPGDGRAVGHARHCEEADVGPRVLGEVTQGDDAPERQAERQAGGAQHEARRVPTCLGAHRRNTAVIPVACSMARAHVGLALPSQTGPCHRSKRKPGAARAVRTTRVPI
jgi:hypothetical protein